MDTLSQRFSAHWRLNFSRLLGARVLLAVSGGADSMAMTHLFQEAGISFGVAHCNFSLRGHESDLDEELVRSWCASRGIAFHPIKFDTKSRSAEWKKGTQETARILRYQWFESLRLEHGYVAIATAHHANDNVETMLINLFRGTGIRGIHGILPDHANIIRPLLFTDRVSLMGFVENNKIPYREDASNASDDYLRNALRHNVIPELQKLFTDAVGNANASIARFAEAEVLYDRAIDAERKQLLEKRGNDLYIPIRKLIKRQPVTTICYELLRPFGFSSAQIVDILNLLQSASGHFVASATHRVIRDRDFLIITAAAPAAADLVEVSSIPCTVLTTRHQYTFAVTNKPDVLSESADVAVIDMAEITFPLVFRTWRTGDYFYPLGMGMKKKKVSRLLIEKKVPIHLKEEIRILECNKRIIWVSGIRLDERFKVKPATASVLVVTRTAR